MHTPESYRQQKSSPPKGDIQDALSEEKDTFFTEVSRIEMALEDIKNETLEQIDAELEKLTSNVRAYYASKYKECSKEYKEILNAHFHLLLFLSSTLGWYLDEASLASKKAAIQSSYNNFQAQVLHTSRIVLDELQNQSLSGFTKIHNMRNYFNFLYKSFEKEVERIEAMVATHKFIMQKYTFLFNETKSRMEKILNTPQLPKHTLIPKTILPGYSTINTPFPKEMFMSEIVVDIPEKNHPLSHLSVNQKVHLYKAEYQYMSVN